MKEYLWVEIESHRYPVVVGKGILSVGGEFLKETFPPSKTLVVSDENVWPHYGDSLTHSLQKAGFTVHQRVIPPGENSKNLNLVQELYQQSIEAGLDRNSLMIALGGGVVGDVTGFVAATYLRGVPYIQIPTTLLSQVDSSVGGKVGVNHSRGKNLIGAFYHPSLVLVDLSTLLTLLNREFRAGMGEVSKYGVMRDPAFFRWLEESVDEMLLRRELSLIKHAVIRSLENKVEVVKKDAKEQGLRRILNLGHTFGHALEAATSYQYYLHGEAVLVGMSMAASLSLSLGLITKEEQLRLEGLFQRIGKVAPPPNLKVEQVWECLRYDKKRQAEKLILVLPSGIGEVQIYTQPPDSLIRTAIEEHLCLNP